MSKGKKKGKKGSDGGVEVTVHANANRLLAEPAVRDRVLGLVRELLPKMTQELKGDAGARALSYVQVGETRILVYVSPQRVRLMTWDDLPDVPAGAVREEFASMMRTLGMGPTAPSVN